MESWYPHKLHVVPEDSEPTLSFLARTFEPERTFHYAEFGVYKGFTAARVAERFANATLHLFDFDRVLDEIKPTFERFAARVHFYGNTEKFHDSYNWSALRLLRERRGQLFDYAYIDGAHTVAVDALTFFLCDRLLRPGGYIDFDDYDWRLRGSSLDPARLPLIRDLYTEEQIDSYQVRLIVDVLVKGSNRYAEVVSNKVFRKLRD